MILDDRSFYSLQAYAEWVLFMCSGVSSGLYHACDVGTWCPLSFHVLQVSVIGTVVSVFQVLSLFSIFFFEGSLFQGVIDHELVFLMFSVHGFLALVHGCGEYFCVPS